jgi:hypothetical protein
VMSRRVKTRAAGRTPRRWPLHWSSPTPFLGSGSRVHLRHTVSHAILCYSTAAWKTNPPLVRWLTSECSKHHHQHNQHMRVPNWQETSRNLGVSPEVELLKVSLSTPCPMQKQLKNTKETLWSHQMHGIKCALLKTGLAVPTQASILTSSSQTHPSTKCYF